MVTNLIDPPPTGQQSEARQSRDEWKSWISRSLVAIAVMFGMWLGHRTLDTMDTYGQSIASLNLSVAGMNQALQSLTRDRDTNYNNILQQLTDHESRLRQDRELLVQHGVRITEHDVRITGVEKLIPSPRR